MGEPIYSFLGHPLEPGMAARFPDKLVLRDERDGSLVMRMRTEQLAVLVKATRVHIGKAAVR